MAGTTTATIGDLINVDSLYAAVITADTSSAYTPGTPFYLAPVGELKHDPKADSVISYYDGAAMFAYAFEGEAEETITIPGLTEQVLAELTGKSFDSSTGVVWDNGDPSLSSFYALGYHWQHGSSAGGVIDKYRWFHKGLFIPSSEDAKTKGSKTDPQQLQLTYKPLRTIHKWSIPDPRDATGTTKITTGLKVARADTSNASFAGAANWFSAVQVPETAH